ncbi:GNAT family N-acetyltransferase [Rhodoferax sp. AJA081-3]|uniref:GNAT family N-acetyltransferase n=1 Tax=Rhodoferax sp. AJA081-3 TaxID=2752316 RepID=UPI001ADF44BF|nr:GNAT family N-acetyltransferase [Rhodoferax sp. AJA081-3]QTN28828.1 GNAT family N-acetyltransferase [Rhodoferax sp. AJA081-3]
MHIRTDDLTGPEVHRLMQEHLDHMHQLSPPESVHALGLDALRRPEITFWTIWSKDAELMGSGALKELSADHGEIKSMRTAAAHRNKGAAKAMMVHILAEARKRSYGRLSLETGSVPGFEPAIKLYEGFGFQRCGPFADYPEDPYSVFMTLSL